MDFFMVEKLGAVSMRNGVVRVQCITTGADGQDKITGELLIPAIQYTQIVNALQYAGKQLQEKMEQAIKEQKEAVKEQK